MRKAMTSPTPLISKPEETVQEIIERAKEAANKCDGTTEEYFTRETREYKQGPPPGMSSYSAGIPARYIDCTFDNFKGNDKLRDGLRKLSGESILLTGSTGTGKTHFAVALMKEINKSHSRFITVPNLLMKIRDCFRKDSSKTESGIVSEYAAYDVLCLDDLGAEKTSEFSIATLSLILDKRISNMNQTIITTNLSLAEIEQTLGARIASRLSEMKVAKINMTDYRKKR